MQCFDDLLHIQFNTNKKIVKVHLINLITTVLIIHLYQIKRLDQIKKIGREIK